MTTQEAIKELLDIELRVPVMRPQKQRDALKLGREALKAWDRLRKGPAGVYDSLLPGETEE